jgi:hypothetical protein
MTEREAILEGALFEVKQRATGAVAAGVTEESRGSTAPVEGEIRGDPPGTA